MSSTHSAILKRIDGSWKQYSWNDYGAEVYRYKKLLEEAGIEKGDCVAILSNSRPEWAWIDVAILSLGAVTVPIYPSLLDTDVEYILKDSESKLVFAEDNSQKQKLETVLSKGELSVQVRMIQSAESSDNPLIKNVSDCFEGLSLAKAETPPKDEWESWKSQSANLNKEDLASIVYTSGTSGTPKGVQLTHGCFIGFIKSTHEALGMDSTDTTLLFLPLAHILGRVEHMLSLGVGWTNAYAENLKAVMDNLIEVRPTVMVSVPRIYEKIFATLVSKVEKMEGLGKVFAQKAVDFSKVYSEKIEKGNSPSIADKLQYAAYSKVLYGKVKKRFGGRLKYCISGGAPFSPDISRFFHACDVLILEGYGLTETTGPLSVNRQKSFRIGSVGKALNDIDVKIADDGEILVKGPNVMKGYYKKEEATQEVFVEGYFATGDIGIVDEDGFIRITDRKKDIIVTAGGKNIAPQKIESKLVEMPLFSQAIVVGDKQKYLGALIALSPPDARSLAKTNGIDMSGSLQDLYDNADFKRLVMKKVQSLNKTLASFETIKKIEFLPRELSVEEGELTPSLKVKRKYCEKKYKDLVSKLF